MRTRLALVMLSTALAALIGGCGGDGAASDAKAPPSSSSPPTPTQPAAEDLKTVCPEVEAALPPHLMVPSPEQLVQIHNDVMAIQARADLEAKNAVQLFMNGMEDAAAAYNDTTEPAPALGASEAFDRGLSEFAARCRSAGSTALQ